VEKVEDGLEQAERFLDRFILETGTGTSARERIVAKAPNPIR
jgi:hypothetical protein